MKLLDNEDETPRNPNQLELFDDPMRDMIDRLYEQLLNPPPAFKRLVAYMDQLEAERKRQPARRQKAKQIKNAASRGQPAQASHQQFQTPKRQRWPD